MVIDDELKTRYKSYRWSLLPSALSQALKKLTRPIKNEKNKVL